MKPYAHHHGRKSLDEYIQYLPRPLRNLALKLRTKEWAFIHVYSTDQAVLSIIDKRTMSPDVINFWTQVYRHYLGSAPLPNASEYPERENNELPEVTGDMTDAMKARIIFQKNPQGLTSAELRGKFNELGFTRSRHQVHQLINYLRVKKEEIAKEENNTYVWINS